MVDTTTTATCANGAGCKLFDPVTKTPALTDDGLCWMCLTVAERDVAALVLDYLDLAQLHESSLSQALNEPVSGSTESPLLIAGHVEALQAEIVHVTGVWADELRTLHRLHQPTAPVADWHTTVTLRPPPARVRPGHAVQTNIAVITPRLRTLARLPATCVYPTGVEDDTADVTGVEAVWHLVDLHKRSRRKLGRTRRTLALYGQCPECHRADLFRQEPACAGDEPPVWCDTCGATRVYGDYEEYMGNLGRWPESSEVPA